MYSLWQHLLLLLINLAPTSSYYNNFLSSSIRCQNWHVDLLSICYYCWLIQLLLVAITIIFYHRLYDVKIGMLICSVLPLFQFNGIKFNYTWGLHVVLCSFVQLFLNLRCFILSKINLKILRYQTQKIHYSKKITEQLCLETCRAQLLKIDQITLNKITFNFNALIFHYIFYWIIILKIRRTLWNKNYY